MRNHHYALGATLLLALAFPWTLAAAADLNAPIDMQAVQLQPQEQNGIRYVCLGIFSALEIERRPRGASRGKPAPTFVATCRSSQAMVVRLGA